MSDNGTGMVEPPNPEPSGAVTSDKTTRKNPIQGRLRSNVANQKTMIRIDRNKHGIRRETTIGPKKTRPKKV